MPKQYLQTQDIFNKVFENNSGTLRGTYNSTQDCLNAVYDSSKDALRIKIDGATIQSVSSESELPSNASEGQICTVVSENGTTKFYRMKNGNWSVLTIQGVGSGEPVSSLTESEQNALSWLVNNIGRMQDVAGNDYSIKMELVTLTSSLVTPIILNIQGEEQNIDDEGNLDGDTATHYRIDVQGYVLNIETYADENATSTDRYLTKITYDVGANSTNTSHIYFEIDEYEYFSNLPNGKNIMKIFYVSNI